MPSPKDKNPDADLQLEDAQLLDSLKTNITHAYNSGSSDVPSNSEISEQEDWEELNDTNIQKAMDQMDSDLHDPD